MLLAQDPRGGELHHFLPAVGQGVDQPRRARGAMAGTFVACLELAKQGEVDTEQDELFEPVWIRNRSAQRDRRRFARMMPVLLSRKPAISSGSMMSLRSRSRVLSPGMSKVCRPLKSQR